MSALPAASFLMEFGAEPAGPAGLDAAVAAGLASDEVAAPVQSFTADDLAAAAAEAHARGCAEATAAAEAAAEARFAELAADYELRLAAAREDWAAGEGARHAEAIAKSMQEIGSGVAGIAARLLWPLVIKAVGAAALDQLIEKLEDLIARDLGRDLAVTAPGHLLPAIKSHLEGTLDGVKFEESGSGEVRVAAGNTVIETRIGAWVERLKEAFA